MYIKNIIEEKNHTVPMCKLLHYRLTNTWSWVRFFECCAKDLEKGKENAIAANIYTDLLEFGYKNIGVVITRNVVVTPMQW